MELSVLLKNIEYRVVQGGNAEITSVVHDSRLACEGALFICLRGLAADGHDYINKAAESGASAILIEETHENIPPDVCVISVKNTRKAMAFVAANFYGNPAEKLRLIGVTGTNGKTTTTDFIEQILRAVGRKTGLIGTVEARALGKPVGIAFKTSTTPDPLELHKIFAKMAEMGVQDVVMEVSSHALAFHKVDGLTFEIGVFTNLTQDHLDLHGTMENYRLAKAQLFTKCRFAVVNIDDESTPTMLEHHGADPFVTYGIEKKADFQAIHIHTDADGIGFDLAAKPDNDTDVPCAHGCGRFFMAEKGRFNIYNALAAITTVNTLGIPLEGLCDIISHLRVPPGRIQSVSNSRNVNILVDYAHSPDGLKNIISAVREFTSGRVVTLIGCGGERDKDKRPIMGRIAGEMSDYVILTSDNPRNEAPMVIIEQIEEGTKGTGTPYEVCESRREAIFIGVESLNRGDSLIIAGKGHEDYQIVGTVKHHFSDYETALEALQ